MSEQKNRIESSNNDGEPPVRPSQLDMIETRHTRDRWKDALFIGLAVLLTAVSIGAVTSKAAGKPTEHAWSVKVVDDNGTPIDTTQAQVAR